MDDADIRTRLERYRPVGPSPRLRAKILASCTAPVAHRPRLSAVAALPLIVAAGAAVYAGLWFWPAEPSRDASAPAPVAATNVGPSSPDDRLRPRTTAETRETSPNESLPSSSDGRLVGHRSERVADTALLETWLRDGERLRLLQSPSAPTLHVPLIEIAPIEVPPLRTGSGVEGSS